MSIRVLVAMLYGGGVTLSVAALPMNALHDPATIRLGQMASSVWPDGSVAVAIALVNPGTQGASAVTVSSVSLGAGKLLSAPSALKLGDIPGGQRAVLQVRFGLVKVPGAFTVRVSGHFRTSRRSRAPFSLTGLLSVKPSGTGSAGAGAGSLGPQKTLGKPIPGAPVFTRPFQGVEPAGPPIPDGPNTGAAPHPRSSAKPARTSKLTRSHRTNGPSRRTRNSSD